MPAECQEGGRGVGCLRSAGDAIGPRAVLGPPTALFSTPVPCGGLGASAKRLLSELELECALSPSKGGEMALASPEVPSQVQLLCRADSFKPHQELSGHVLGRCRLEMSETWVLDSFLEDSSYGHGWKLTNKSRREK
ncbi:uncharacterized protein LOC143831999 [Paroedura picta]|uniref:uncharacterized protein LOC143831999 n=1 Tax=Paroedura picta TaxID=143630 RepID=UPI0040560EA7